jgi:short-subunit dehydrogenase
VGRIFASRKCSIALAGRNRERLEAVATDLRLRGAQSTVILEADLADPVGHPNLIESAARRFAGLDVAVLAYGVLGDQRKAEEDPRAALEILNTNFTSAVSLITILVNRFESEGAGHLAVIGSVAGDRGRKSNYVYGASKGALDIFLQGVRHRVAGKGIRVVTVKPGPVDTPMTAHMPKTGLFAAAPEVAAGIVRALEQGKGVVYLPFHWRLIMGLIRNVPETIFHKLNI